MKNTAVLGATGLVGEEVIKILEQRNFPVKKMFLFAPEQNEVKTVLFKDSEIEVLADYESFVGEVELVFSCLHTPLAKEIVPKLRDKAVVIDSSNAFRMDPEVPLVVPGVNPEKIRDHKSIIANPNCLTTQLLVALYPLHKKSKVKRVFVATYQSVSSYGRKAVDELKFECEYLVLDQSIEKADDCVFQHPIGNNVIPQIGGFGDEGYTTEEMGLANEMRKILGNESIRVTSTCVHVPVCIGHSEAVSVEFENPISPQEAKKIFKSAPGINLSDDKKYPMPVYAAGKDAVFVGRIRKDLAFEHGLAMWIVADNIRRCAALNAVQIAELL